MNNVLSIDIETKNLSHEIGGWGNPHLFKVACVATWDGQNAKLYSDDGGESSFCKSEGVEWKPLKELKYDLDDHFQKGGKLLGHNINVFDLPVLRDSMDIYIVRKYLQEKEDRCIDTSALLSKATGKRIHLDNAVKCTLDTGKLMAGTDAVVKWRAGEFEEVLKYCLSDTKLTYDLWQYGQDNGIVKFYDDEEDSIESIEINW
jgi:DEAD/DEAH box helicase domain-containing protein